MYTTKFRKLDNFCKCLHLLPRYLKTWWSFCYQTFRILSPGKCLKLNSFWERLQLYASDCLRKCTKNIFTSITATMQDIDLQFGEWVPWVYPHNIVKEEHFYMKSQNIMHLKKRAVLQQITSQHLDEAVSQYMVKCYQTQPYIGNDKVHMPLPLYMTK